MAALGARPVALAYNWIVSTDPSAGGLSPVAGVHHLGMVVRDLSRTIAAMKTAYGLGPFQVSDDDYAARRQGVEIRVSLRVAFGWLGETLLEVLEPRDDESPHAEFLAEQGGGLHHVCWLVPSVDDYVAAAGTRITLDGYGEGRGHRWAYLEPVEGGLVPEIIEDNASSARMFEKIRGAIGPSGASARALG